MSATVHVIHAKAKLLPKRELWKHTREFGIALIVATPPAIAIDLLMSPIHRIFEHIPSAKIEGVCDANNTKMASSGIHMKNAESNSEAVLRCAKTIMKNEANMLHI